MTAQAEILAKVRRALASAQLPTAPSLPLRVAPALPSGADLVAQFSAEWQALSGTFFRSTHAAAPAFIAQLLRERAATQLLGWAPDQLPVPGLLAYLQAENFKVDLGDLGAPAPRAARLALVETFKVGLTGVDAVLADTGTLALRAGPGRSRLASLSVETHIALFTTAQLHASWAAWWAALPEAAAWVQSASNLTLISGPSRTADIEMTLTVGVHGPRETIAIWLE